MFELLGSRLRLLVGFSRLFGKELVGLVPKIIVADVHIDMDIRDLSR